MKIQISGNLIKQYLRHVYFINGHSSAGKSTMVKLFSERYDMIFCGENYRDAFPREKLSRWKQPGLCYFDAMSGWEEWLAWRPLRTKTQPVRPLRLSEACLPLSTEAISVLRYRRLGCWAVKNAYSLF